jgi:hypothetical protein
MTPEDKIKQLRKAGRNYTDSIGEPITAILTAIAAVIGALGTLFSIFMTIFQFVVTAPDEPEVGVPMEEDWDIAGARASASRTNRLPILLVGAIGLYWLFNKKK